MKRIAIMQPYFLPYAGYFRLFAGTDLFVAYDCVQFARRGWVHRNQLTRYDGHKDWITLPIAKAPQSVKINELEFAATATERWEEEKRRFPVFRTGSHPVLHSADLLQATPLEFIMSTLKECCHLMDIPFNTVYSSSLDIPDDVHGEERIIAICKEVGAEQYVNAPGGKLLYSEDRFQMENIELKFLPDYQGGFASILERLQHEAPEDVCRELSEQI